MCFSVRKAQCLTWILLIKSTIREVSISVYSVCAHSAQFLKCFYTHSFQHYDIIILSVSKTTMCFHWYLYIPADYLHLCSVKLTVCSPPSTHTHTECVIGLCNRFVYTYCLMLLHFERYWAEWLQRVIVETVHYLFMHTRKLTL